jgi:hypothetical protein
LIYINFNLDFLDLHNVFFKNYFANELARSIVRSFAVRVLSDLIRNSASPRIFISDKTLMLMFQIYIKHVDWKNET